MSSEVYWRLVRLDFHQKRSPSQCGADGWQAIPDYRAHFTVLDLPTVSRRWNSEIIAGDTVGHECPTVWRKWVDGVFAPLQAPRSVTVRSRPEQLPTSKVSLDILEVIWQYFAVAPHLFEGFAEDLWLMSDDPGCQRRCDPPDQRRWPRCHGEFLIGPKSDSIKIDFVLEAKCYAVANGVGVRVVSRLISRLRARQFGILVTTSYLADQAYQEITEDGHPIVVIGGNDIVEILSQVGFRTPDEVLDYLRKNHPAPATVPDMDTAFPPEQMAVVHQDDASSHPIDLNQIHQLAPPPPAP